MTKRELNRELKTWRKRLCLQQWNIELKIGVRVKDNPRPYSSDLSEDCVGQCWWMPESPNAVIVIEKGQGVHTLVHELLHLRLEGHLGARGEYDAQYERALNHLVDCLVGTPEVDY